VALNGVMKGESNTDFATQRHDRNSMEGVLVMWIEN